jgi:hypothetical protein
MTASEATSVDEARLGTGRRRREGEQDADDVINDSSSEPVFTRLQIFSPALPLKKKKTLGPSKKHTFALAAALRDHLGEEEAGDVVLHVGEERLTAYSAVLQARHRL